VLFGRDKTPPTPPSSATREKSGGKGRATPRRKQAESANRRPLVPETRAKSGTSKEARAAARAQARAARDAEYRAMQDGDEAHMPAQHRGPVRRYVRDVVDSHRTLAEYFLPLALVMLLAAMVLSGPLSTQGTGGARIAMALMALPYVYLLASAIDTVWRWRRLKQVLTRKFGASGTARGTVGYFVTRVYQLRRLRMPRPQVKPGDLPR
jgi:hypothetical protein